MFLCLLLFLSMQCINSKPANKKDTKYLFYLHGRIIEDQGINAVSEKYGLYQYTKILNTLEQEGLIVKSDARKENTDVIIYAHKIVQEINTLIQSGIAPENITVLGASKGSLIAMLVSTELGNSDLNFILMGNCNDWVLENFDINLQGHILSIYEKSDEFGNSCEAIVANSKQVKTFKEIVLETNLGHGFLYQPLEDWIVPAVEWINILH